MLADTDNNAAINPYIAIAIVISRGIIDNVAPRSRLRELLGGRRRMSLVCCSSSFDLSSGICSTIDYGTNSQVNSAFTNAAPRR